MKIVSVFLKYDYGIKTRGVSIEKKYFYPALKKVFKGIVPFWLEDNGFVEDRGLLQRKLLDFCNSEKPDIVFFVLMNNEIDIATLDKLYKKYITINWFCDDEWRFETFSKDIANHFHYCITMDKYSIKKYKEIGQKKVILSHWGIFEYIENLDLDNVKYNYDISFIGSKNRIREWYVNSLKKKGISVRCFGSGWEVGKVSFENLREIFMTSKINLNISNSASSDYRFLLSSPFNFLSFFKSNKKMEQIKARNFEILSFGGFELTNYVIGLEDYFEIGKDIAVYTNINDIYLQIQYFLENDSLRKNISKNGYTKIKKYTYENIFKEIFNKVK